MTETASETESKVADGSGGGVADKPAGQAVQQVYYINNPDKCLHPEFKSEEQAKQWVRMHKDQEVHILYYRILQGLLYVKIGKSKISWNEDKKDAIVVRKGTDSNMPDSLRNVCIIPCQDENASYVIEKIMQRTFGHSEHSQALTPEANRLISKKYPIISNLDAPVSQDDLGNRSGKEFFKPELTVKMFQQNLEKITGKSVSVNTNYLDQRMEHQREYEERLTRFIKARRKDQDLDKEFYTLIKPRGRKNRPTIAGIVMAFIESGDDYWDILIRSFWPSANYGFEKDIEGVYYHEGVKIAFVDTFYPDWKTKRQAHIDNGVNIVFTYASMQALSKRYNDHIKNDVDYAEKMGLDPDEHEYNATLAEEVKSIEWEGTIRDEMDHGMRTANSLTIDGDVPSRWYVNLSGSDLYALKHIDLTDENSFVYDIITEDELIEAGKISGMPQIKFKSFEWSQILEIPEDIMDIDDSSQRIANLFITNTRKKLDGKSAEEKNRIRKVKKVFAGKRLDGDGQIIYPSNKTQIAKIFKSLSDTELQDNSIWDHDHIFISVPDRLAGFGLFNWLQDNKSLYDLDQFDVQTSWDFGSAGNREQQVNDWMAKNTKTIFITVGMMLRGASCPWSCVIRMDDYSDYKVGLQLALRSQNDFGPDGKTCEVYDINPFRAKSFVGEIAESCSTGDNFGEMLTKARRFIPWIFNGSTRPSIQADRDECLANFRALRSINESFKKDSNFDLDRLKQTTILDHTPHEDEEVDSRKGGKVNTVIDKPSSNSEKDVKDKQLAKKIKQARQLSKRLVVLQFINDNKYHTIDDLIINGDREFLGDTLEELNISRNTDREELIGLFNKEKINHCLLASQRKMQKGMSPEQLHNLSDSKTGDVSLPYSSLEYFISMIPKTFLKKYPKILVLNCGRGEWLTSLKSRMLEIGLDEQKINDCLDYADNKRSNVKLTNKKLGLDKGFVYNYGADKFEKLKAQYGDMKINLIVGNPPFNISKNQTQSGTGGDSTLYKRFYNLGHELGVDMMAMIIPKGILGEMSKTNKQVDIIHLMNDKKYWQGKKQYNTLFFIEQNTEKSSEPKFMGDPICGKMLGWQEWGYKEMGPHHGEYARGDTKAIIELPNKKNKFTIQYGNVNASKVSRGAGWKFCSARMQADTSRIKSDLPFYAEGFTIQCSSEGEVDSLMKFLQFNKAGKYFRKKMNLKGHDKDLMRYMKKFDLSQIKTGFEMPREFSFTPAEETIIENAVESK